VEVAVTTILEPGQGRVFPIGGDRVTVKGMSDVLGVGFSLVDYSAAPGVPGPPLHVHDAIDEAWYLLEGQLNVQVGEERRLVGAGSFLLVPHAIPHTFVNAGEDWARWVGVLSPGTALGMLEELGQILSQSDPPDEDAIARMFERYGTAVLGPPLASPS
jgi:mannose-6-phosphate isomerase-like protein (cupin superfamily)